MTNSIVIVDDHVLIAKALQSIITNFKQFEVLYECQNGKELQEKFNNPKNIPDLVILDISMPVMNGFETAEWLKKHHPKILILALSMQDDDESVIKMVKNGSKGYLLKNASPIELELALCTMIKTGFYYPEWTVSKLFANLNEKEVSRTVTNLSDREKEFLTYTTTEMTYKEISEKMFCSPRTIENYRDSLFEKLELKTRVGLAVYALKNGF
jgi:DNA-binding NarL/FixJ family response regulator